MRVETGFSSAFRKSFKNRIQQDEKLERKFWSRLDKFCQDPFDPILKTHKLSGKLKGLWSFSIEYDCRVIFEFIEDNKALFIDIGSHDEIY